MYLSKKKLPVFQIFSIDPNFSCLKFLLTFLDKVKVRSLFCITYNIGKNILYMFCLLILPSPFREY